MELHELTAAETAARVRRGELDPLAYARALLERLTAIEPRISAMAWFDADRFMASALSQRVTGEAVEVEDVD